MQNIVTLKLLETTRDNLRVIAALTKETQQEAAERIIKAELKKLQTK